MDVSNRMYQDKLAFHLSWIEELILQEEELGQEPLSKKLMLEQLLELGPARGCDLYFAQIFPLTFALGKNENWEAVEGSNMDSQKDGLAYQLEDSSL